MTLVPLHSSPNLPVPPELGLVVIGVGAIVFTIITYDIARNYVLPTRRGE